MPTNQKVIFKKIIGDPPNISLEPGEIYLSRAREGFDMYVVNQSGTIPYKINDPVKQYTHVISQELVGDIFTMYTGLTITKNALTSDPVWIVNKSVTDRSTDTTTKTDTGNDYDQILDNYLGLTYS